MQALLQPPLLRPVVPLRQVRQPPWAVRSATGAARSWWSMPRRVQRLERSPGAAAAKQRCSPRRRGAPYLKCPARLELRLQEAPQLQASAPARKLRPTCPWARLPAGEGTRSTPRQREWRQSSRSVAPSRGWRAQPQLARHQLAMAAQSQEPAWPLPESSPLPVPPPPSPLPWLGSTKRAGQSRSGRRGWPSRPRAAPPGWEERKQAGREQCPRRRPPGRLCALSLLPWPLSPPPWPASPLPSPLASLLARRPWLQPPPAWLGWLVASCLPTRPPSPARSPKRPPPRSSPAF